MAATASKQFELKGLGEKRAKVRTEIEAIGTAMRTENRAIKPEEREKFNRLNKDLVELGEQIRSGEADLKAIDEAVASARDNSSIARPGKESVSHRPADRSPEQRSADIKIARQAWARRQYGLPLTRDHKEACKRVGLNPNSKELTLRLGPPETRGERVQKRALTVTTTAGGYLIAEDYSFELEYGRH